MKASPVLLFYRGEFLALNMKKERIVKDEILSAVREEGLSNLWDVEAVILEANGALVCLKKSARRPVIEENLTYPVPASAMH